MSLKREMRAESEQRQNTNGIAENIQTVISD